MKIFQDGMLISRRSGLTKISHQLPKTMLREWKTWWAFLFASLVWDPEEMRWSLKNEWQTDFSEANLGFPWLAKDWITSKWCKDSGYYVFLLRSTLKSTENWSYNACMWEFCGQCSLLTLKAMKRSKACCLGIERAQFTLDQSFTDRHWNILKSMLLLFFYPPTWLAQKVLLALEPDPYIFSIWYAHCSAPFPFLFWRYVKLLELQA